MTQVQPRTLSEVRRNYRDRHQKFLAEAESIAAQCHRIGNFRGVSFAIFVVGGGFYLSQGSQLGGVLSLAGGLIFAFLVQHHGKVLAREEHKRRFAMVNEHALKRTTNDWHGLQRAGLNFAPEGHGYAGDLDLFGVGSLYQRISVAHTRYGQRILANWIAEPASLGEIKARQQAMLELSPCLEFRQELEAEGMALVEKRRGEFSELSDGPNPARLLEWVEKPGKMAGNLLLTVLSFLIPVAIFSGIYAQVWLDKTPLFWMVPVVLGIVLLSLTKDSTSETFAAVSTTEGAFLRYGALLEILEKHEATAPWFVERKKKLRIDGSAKPSEIMRRFRSLVGWYDLRHNGMAYPFINAVFLWDLHCTRALDRWKQDVGRELRGWFEIIGEYEAISSLAGLHGDDAHATLPQVTDSQNDASAVISAEKLGHPLLSSDQRIENDVAPFAPGQALLVTGSNMSGKSTFLRALGVNTVLAFCGGPVIARHFSVPLCSLGTSIRISDSLKSGVSHFYAEVQKLADVVKLTEGKLPVLFLLDEVLHGTNSRERQIGARWVLAELLRKSAFGIITTHDMELCRLPETLMSSVRQHHFRESVNKGEMTFDYTLREGPVTSGNALRLMQRVGLQVPLEEDVPLQ